MSMFLARQGRRNNARKGNPSETTRRPLKRLRSQRKRIGNQRINKAIGTALHRGANEASPRPEASKPFRSLPIATIPLEVTNASPESRDKYVGGEFILGPKLKGSPVACVQHYLERRKNTDEFYVIKMLTVKATTPTKEELKDELSGRSLLLNEHSLLSLFANEPGIFHGRGLIKEVIPEKLVSPEGEVTWKEITRFSLIVDCYVQHDFSPKYDSLVNLQIHIIQEKKLKEGEAIRIFYRMLQIVTRIHELNIVHMDLKLGSFLNRETGEVTLANFSLGRHLAHQHQPMCDQRGSPAYVSVVCAKPYFAKPRDMWAMGVVFYIMLYGAFPFYDPNPTELFRKIKMGKFEIPATEAVSDKTIQLLKPLLDRDWKQRPTASKALEEAQEELAFLEDSEEQIVPLSDPRGVGDIAQRMVNFFELQDLVEENEARIKSLINGGTDGETEIRNQNQVPAPLERTPCTYFQVVI